MKQNNQENNNIFYKGGWKARARGIPKGGFGRVLARKAKKVKSYGRLIGAGLGTQVSVGGRCFLLCKIYNKHN